MNRRQWSRPVDSASAYARARGRYRHNRARQIIALERRAVVAQISLKLLQESIAAGETFYTRPLWGKQRLIAQALGVHPSTISRDIKTSWEISRLFAPCPTCGQRTPRHDLEARVLDLVTRLRAAYPELDSPSATQS
jgi:lambda repressor-like predicted transcriptional regulator